MICRYLVHIWLFKPYGIKCHSAPKKARPLFDQRIDYEDGSTVETMIWRVPSGPAINHGLKYSLVYGRPGVREVGYDNERGKGDRHLQGVETVYRFSTVEKLMADFRSDVRGDK